MWCMSGISVCGVGLQFGCARSGLASHAVTHAVLSGAAMGHDQVRDGTGWFHGALDHAHTRTDDTYPTEMLRITPRSPVLLSCFAC